MWTEHQCFRHVGRGAGILPVGGGRSEFPENGFSPLVGPAFCSFRLSSQTASGGPYTSIGNRTTFSTIRRTARSVSARLRARDSIPRAGLSNRIPGESAPRAFRSAGIRLDRRGRRDFDEAGFVSCREQNSVANSKRRRAARGLRWVGSPDCRENDWVGCQPVSRRRLSLERMNGRVANLPHCGISF